MQPPDGPHAFIQWKGTDVCMDFRCPCGGGGHYDGDFAYFVRCPACGTVYEMDWYVRAFPVDGRIRAEPKELLP